MKEFKRVVLAMMLMTFVFVACSDEDDAPPYIPNATIVSALRQLYPRAEDVEWLKRAQYYVAVFKSMGTDFQVWLDGGANWVMTETKLNSIHDLMPAVYTAFITSEYYSWEVEEVAVLSYPLGLIESLIEVKKQERELALYYSRNGNLMHVKDVSYGEHIHWPSTN